MTTSPSRLAILGTIIAIFAVGAMLGVSPLQAWESVCDNCYTKHEEFLDGWHRVAQCCLSGSYQCTHLAQDGWSRTRYDMSWCSVSTDLFGDEQCNGSSGSCSGGGGGGGGIDGPGGGGACTIGLHELCPATCFSCERVF